MLFEPLYHDEKLTIINPSATLAVVTLWSRVDTVRKKLRAAGISLSPEDSKVAVMGNLYGEGFRYLVRNLLHNPQIDTLLVMGRDSSGSAKYPVNFFGRGVEHVEHDVVYECGSADKKISAVRIIGTGHVLDDMVTPDLFENKPRIVHIEGIDDQAVEKAAAFIRAHESRGRSGKRIAVPVPEVRVTHFPSNPRAHTVVEETPAEAWRSLVHRIFRFGREVSIAKGRRRELQNVKVVIESPRFEEEETIRDCGFSPESFREYRKTMLSGELPSDKEYTYGHRIRAFFGIDTLETVADQLSSGLDDRNCYITTWNNQTDITGNSRPCLAALFFRKDGNTLHLTATFRTHNASNAWYENVYGLMAFQDFACERAGLSPGSVTVISHSISLDPAYLEKVKMIHDKTAKTNRVRMDPNGHFTITVDGEEIVAAHWSGSVIIHEYRAKKPEKLQHMIARDLAVSDVGHALYLGRQLERAFRCIREGTDYIQS